MLSEAGYSSGGTNEKPTSNANSVYVSYTDIPLPSLKPMAHPSTPVGERLFIVCQPRAIPEDILNDCFSRYGDLIRVSLTPGKYFCMITCYMGWAYH